MSSANSKIAVPPAEELKVDTYPTVSVIIPVHNGEKTIGRCLSAILDQRYPSDRMEVIVVDNGSHDATPRIAKEHPVRYVHEARIGVSAARNTGIRHARGEILLFMDADCIADRNLILEHVVAHIHFREHDPSIAAIGGGIEGENKNYWAACDDFFSWFLFHPCCKPSMTAFHSTANLSVSRSALSPSDRFDESLDYAEDFVFCASLAKKGLRVYFHPRAKITHVNRTSLRDAILHSRSWTKTQFQIREKGFVRREFLSNELAIIAYYLFYYTLVQLSGLVSRVWSSKRYHVVFYLPFVILLGLVYLYCELREELRFHRHRKRISERRVRDRVL